MQIGFIGFGHLGTAIAGRLQERGHRLVAWNRTSAKVKTLSLEPADSPRVVGEAAEVVFLCLFDSRAVQNVLTGDQGLLAGKVAGKVIVDLTTNHFEDVRTFHELCRQAGASYLEAPVLGSVTPASKGALTVLVSGTEEAYTAVRPLLEEIGEHLFHLPEPATATKMKLVNNLCLGTIMAVVGEAVATAEAAGISREQALTVLAEGGGKSLVLDAKRQKLLDRDWSPHFSVGMIAKDLHCLQDLARELERPQHLAGVVKEQYMRLVAAGRREEDFAAIADLFDQGR